jgi:hypothetical protein
MKMKKRALIMLMISGACLGLLLAVLFYSYYLVYDIQLVPMDAKIGNTNALNLDTDALHFGKVQTPGGAGRAVLIANNHNRPLSVLVSVDGELAQWVTLNESRFIMNPTQTREVMLSLDLPSNITFGNYTGTIKLLFMRRLI